MKAEIFLDEEKNCLSSKPLLNACKLYGNKTFNIYIAFTKMEKVERIEKEYEFELHISVPNVV